MHRHTDVAVDSINLGRQTRRAQTTYVSLPKSPIKGRGANASDAGNRLPDTYSYNDTMHDPMQPLSDHQSDSDSDDSDFEAMDPSKNKPPKPGTVS